jgi:hypothetical protein
MNIKLTDLKVKSLASKEKKCISFDSQISGMFVLVRPTGKKVFQIRVREFQKIKDITIGEYGVFTLKAARAKANQIKLFLDIVLLVCKYHRTLKRMGFMLKWM